MEKIYGIMYEVSEYVVAINKGANVYGILKKIWPDLSSLRQAFLADFKTFILPDKAIFTDFIQDLILQRIVLKKLSQASAYKLLNELILEKSY
jgi:hypothetical protein